MTSSAHSRLPLVACLVLAAFGVRLAWSDEAPPPQAPRPTGKLYELRYHFSPGETVRWEVQHRAKVRTTVLGNTQTAETLSDSVKVWQILDVSGDGKVTFEHSVESVEMRQQVTGREEVRYNSETDSQPPPGFEETAASVGVPLLKVTMDAYGNILERRGGNANFDESERQMTIPFPNEPIPRGETWSYAHEIWVKLKNKVSKKIRTRQRFTLEEVKDGIATIAVDTQILTPVNNPEIEAQLIQRASHGKVRFDIKAGRIISQQMDLDKQVVGFNGEASSIHYVTRFTEELSTDTSRPTRQVVRPPQKRTATKKKSPSRPTSRRRRPGTRRR